MANQTGQQSQNTTHHSMSPLVITLILIVAVAAAGALYYFVLRPAQDAANENGNVANTSNTNTAANQNLNIDSANTNTTVDDTSTPSTVDTSSSLPDNAYRNPEFGYSVLYGPQATDLTAVASSTVSGNLYSEWSLRSGDRRVFAVQVFPTSAIEAEFSDRAYIQLDDTESLGVQVQLNAHMLSIDGEQRGYVVSRGAYTFVLLTDFAPDTSEYQIFEDTAQSFSF
ncbi:MAG: hypothetical protein H6760_03070 [Candidatus Nomurabacteria bacterium]|nr:MAG: hypothetical protein H6760_03070 [Candidatus Nomurabacteria bacterium]